MKVTINSAEGTTSHEPAVGDPPQNMLPDVQFPAQEVMIESDGVTHRIDGANVTTLETSSDAT